MLVQAKADFRKIHKKSNIFFIHIHNQLNFLIQQTHMYKNFLKQRKMRSAFAATCQIIMFIHSNTRDTYET